MPYSLMQQENNRNDGKVSSMEKGSIAVFLSGIGFFS